MSEPFRDERDAAFAQSEALRRQVNDLEAENARLREVVEGRRPPAPPPPKQNAGAALAVGALLVVGGIAGSLFFLRQRVEVGAQERQMAARAQAEALQQRAEAEEAARLRAALAEQQAQAALEAARARAEAERARAEEPRAQALLAEVRRGRAVQDCWDAALRHTAPARAERLTLELDVDARGAASPHVTGASDPALNACIESRLARQRFAPGAAAHVTVPLTLDRGE